MECHSLCFLLIVIISYALLQFPVEAKNRGFSLDIFHRNSPLSPLYNPSARPGYLARDNALRSIARANHFQLSNSPSTPVSPDTGSLGEYLTKISIGSPPVEALAIVDTGSDLIWVQCQPCDLCYPQNTPIFNPLSSSTYTNLSCDSNSCQKLQSSCGSGNECEYSYSYGDKSYTKGVLATDTVTFGSTAFPNTTFGCGHNNGGIFSSINGSGIVGVGGGPLSLISQLGAEIDHKFSYCLLPKSSNSSSKLNFGSDAVISGPGVVSTPLLSNSSIPTFYYINLEAVTVGNNTIPYSNQTAGNNEGNIIIDSGNSLNLLPTGFFNQLEAAVKGVVGLGQVSDPNGVFSLCYDTNAFSSVPGMTMVFHFTGADVTLEDLNIFVDLGPMTCLAMFPYDGFSVYGNTAQMNFQVKFDLVSKQVSFAPADCTQF